jgi:hypothetical protein
VLLVLLVAALALTATLIGGARLAQVRLRAVRLLVAAAVVQVGTSALAPASGFARAVALVLTTVLVGLFVYGNRMVAGTPLIGAGLLLNVVVVAANGAMPVSLPAAADAGLTRAVLGLDEDAMREPVDDDTRLALLGDVVPLTLPWRAQVVSPGDVLVASGVGLLLVSAGGRQTPRRRERSTVLDSDSTTVGSYS